MHRGFSLSAWSTAGAPFRAFFKVIFHQAPTLMKPFSSLQASRDVLIVGGGPAGLSAALLLGRCLRTVLVCDNGRPRNRRSPVLNGFLSRDGASPQVLLQAARQQLERYKTVELRDATVMRIERHERYFKAVLDSGDEVEARMVLLANGLVDELPELPGMQALYGVAVHSCPYCHGWECRGKQLAVLGDSDATAELALELAVWSSQVVLCTQGREKYPAEIAARLRFRNIRLESRIVARLESGDAGAFTGLRFKDDSFFPCEAVFVSPGQHQQSEFAQALGCRIGQEDGCIESGRDLQTSVAGVFTAGNASRGIQLAIVAAAEGARAAVAINEALFEAGMKPV